MGGLEKHGPSSTKFPGGKSKPPGKNRELWGNPEITERVWACLWAGKILPGPLWDTGGPSPSSSRGNYPEFPFLGAPEARIRPAETWPQWFEKGVDEAGVRDKSSPSVSTTPASNPWQKVQEERDGGKIGGPRRVFSPPQRHCRKLKDDPWPS
ncbi:hypothetical protein GWK47_015687 [Chionoecetes opilio]|uniref:Uncharacterized protein n=1 Tax=Chionoecetes opilio TaxID=41210 RepID=A0A8J5CKJ1_CHIOP|nr:hypothetical protein GWK47_015687 [Chionoecetes opilio]